MEKKLRKGSFDFEDFLAAMQQMRKLGPLQQILAMIPGMGQMARNEELVSEKDLKRIEAIIFSMTKQERRSPDMIKGRRKERIAKGSGTQVQEVTGLVSQFKQMQRMMKKMGGGGNGKGGGMDPRELMRRLR
jgi:signal recognition particle subunit SRP54